MRLASTWCETLILLSLGSVTVTATAAPVTRTTQPSQAKDRQKEYERLYGEGRYDEAIVLAKETCETLEEKMGEHSADLVACLSDLGVLHNNLGEHATARQLLERSVSIHEQTPGPEDLALASSLASLGYLCAELGEHEKSREFLERALTIRQRNLGTDHPLVAKSLNNLAMTLFGLGDYEQSEPLFQRALAIRERALEPEHPDVISSITNLAGLYQIQGNYEDAGLMYQRLLDVLQRALPPDHPLVADVLNNMGVMYVSTGDHRRAGPLLRRALSITRKALGPSHLKVASSLNNLAGYHELRDEHADAERLLREALSIEESILGPEHPEVAATLNNLTRLYLRQGNYGEAEPLCKRAQDILEKAFGPDHPAVSTSLNNLGGLYREQGRFAEAEPLFARALDIRIKVLGPEHPRIANSLHNLGIVHSDLDWMDSALYLHVRALKIEERNLARTLFTDDSKRSITAATMFHSTNIMLTLHLDSKEQGRDAAAIALNTILRRKGRALDLLSRAQATLRHSLPSAEAHLVGDLLNAQARYAAAVHRGPRDGLDAYSARLSELEREQDRIWAKLRSHSPRIGTLLDPVDIADVQAALPRNSSVVEYVSYYARSRSGSPSRVDHQRYAAYLIFPERFEWVDLGPAKVMDEKIHEFRAAIASKADITASGRALYEALMRPVVDRVGLTNRLFIAPDGNLNLVPFGALLDEHDNYILERFRLHFVTSGRDILRPWALESVADGPVTVVANPTGTNLPGTEYEASLLGSLFPDLVTMQHDFATETRLRAAERPRILHLATHGTFGTGSPSADTETSDTLRSGHSIFEGLASIRLDNPMLYTWLDLATPSDPPGEPSSLPTRPVDVEDDVSLLDDGRLTAYEVSGWNLRGTELVTLSACDTGRGTYRQGEGILGLRRAFAIAGAQTQVMSLWKVSDATTAELMAAYYRRLLSGEGRSEAMRNTQLELLRAPASRHPKDWAAFVVVGEWGPLSGTPHEVPPPITRARGCQLGAGINENTPDSGLPAIALLLLYARRRTRRHPVFVVGGRADVSGQTDAFPRSATPACAAAQGRRSRRTPEPERCAADWRG